MSEPIDKERRQEILEAALSYASSNLDDLNDAFCAEEAAGCAGDVLYVQSRYIARLTEEEVHKMLDDIVNEVMNI